MEVVGREGFEPPKAKPADLQSAAFNHFATCPDTSWTLTADARTRTEDRLFTKQLLYH
jgi:hypothetical protein